MFSHGCDINSKASLKVIGKRERVNIMIGLLAGNMFSQFAKNHNPESLENK